MKDIKLLHALQSIFDYLADDLKDYEMRKREGIEPENHIGTSLLILLRYLRRHYREEF
jgi:TorA maturation chaperone TorD